MRVDLQMICQAFRIIVLLISLVITQLSAETYVVDTNKVGSSDLNSGTELNPWKTIQHSVEIAVGGDTVLIRNGVYSEAMTTVPLFVITYLAGRRPFRSRIAPTFIPSVKAK